MFIRLQSLDPSAEEDKLQKVKMSVVPDTAPPTDGASDVHSEKHADTMTAASVSEAPEPPVMGPRKRPECKRNTLPLSPLLSDSRFRWTACSSRAPPRFGQHPRSK